ncbi:MAG: hypothetical protein PHQ43_00920 [Dehalococcoidales bacterium]|nr:hypothetical protein [Dehalococcoidales bacterium]
MSAIHGETLLRSGVAAADSAVPTTARGVADLSGSPFATIACKVTGSNPSITIYPLLWNETFEAYMLGDGATITGNTELNVAVNGTPDFYLYVSAMTGTNVSLDVTVKPALL